MRYGVHFQHDWATVGNASTDNRSFDVLERPADNLHSVIYGKSVILYVVYLVENK